MIRFIAVLVLAWVCTATPCPAAQSLSPADLDRSISEVLSRREFLWRAPRTLSEDTPGIIFRFLTALLEATRKVFQLIGNVWDKLANWIEDFFGWKTRTRDSWDLSSGIAWITSLQGIFFIVACVFGATLGVLLYRLIRNRRHSEVVAIGEALIIPPDLMDESITADQLPEDEWVELAEQLLGKGEFRLALRAYYLAELASLAGYGVLTIARFKSNRDYLAELHRRAHTWPQFVDAFASSATIFDRSWYGAHEVTERAIESLQSNLQRIKNHARV